MLYFSETINQLTEPFGVTVTSKYICGKSVIYLNGKKDGRWYNESSLQLSSIYDFARILISEVAYG